MVDARLALTWLLWLATGCVPPPGARGDTRGERALTRQAVERQAALERVAEQAHQVESRLRGAGLLAVTAGRPLPLVGAGSGPVPAFDLFTPEGFHYGSRELVGRQAFVVVFFATWCSHCAGELDALRRALESAGPLPVLPIAADRADTWPSVKPYLAGFGVHAAAVRGAMYPAFAAAYDPFDSVPVLVVVGRDGRLIDYHVGYDPRSAERLPSSLELAKARAPRVVPATPEAPRDFARRRTVPRAKLPASG